MVGGSAVVADPCGALFIEDERVLVVADLHLEKGSALALKRTLLPPYDTVATLIRLAPVISYYAPRAVVAPGDSFHDAAGAARLADSDRAALQARQSGREWIWVLGNHEPDAPADLEGTAVDSLTIAGLTLRHQPLSSEGREIAGTPPSGRAAVGARRTVRRRCFVADGSRCILPAFGAYAGGLNVRSTPFRPLFGDRGFTAYVLGRERVFSAAGHRCLTD
jgi:uncharacterized protein